jgi:hypothetical protein
LQQRVEPGAFGLDLVQVRQFRSQRDRVLMGGVARQTELLGAICFDNYSHGDFPFVVLEVNTQRPACSRRGRWSIHWVVFQSPGSKGDGKAG